MAIIFNENFKVARCYSNGTVNNYGTHMKAFVNYTASSAARYKIEFKKVSASSWTIVQPWTNTAASLNTTVISDAAIFETDYAYDIRIVVMSNNEEVVHTAFVTTAFVLVDFNASGKGIALGKVSEKANELEIAMEMYDRYSTRILNGLAHYESGGSSDVNTTLEELVLSSVNTPEAGVFYFVRTMFYSTKTVDANRTQYAIPYGGTNKSTYYRYYNNGSWSAWFPQISIMETGSRGIWNWKKYSDGTAEIIAKFNISNASITTAFGSLFRSNYYVEQTEYVYPVTFSSAPVVEMMFQTTNGNGAMVWPFSASAALSKTNLPQFYLVRPISGTNVTGYVNIIVKGNL